MYEYLNGNLVSKTATTVVLDVKGVGYHVQVPVSTFTALPDLGKEVRILTHFVVREDAQQLFGFYTEEERQLFKLLISVSGIGPKTALTALSGVSVKELKHAIIDGDLTVLTGISGIGRKTAERMVVELREKMVVEERRAPGVSAVPSAGGPVADDSVKALLELGYKKNDAQEAVQKALKGFESGKVRLEELIRASLKYV